MMRVLNVIWFCAFVVAVITVPFLLADTVKFIKARPINRIGASQFLSLIHI